MSARDGAVASAVGSTAGLAIDILLNGGEILIWVGTLLMDQSGLIYLLLSRLLAAAPNVAWLPATQLERLFTAVSLVLAALVLFRLLKNLSQRVTKND
jgi:hypothetical protein